MKKPVWPRGAPIPSFKSYADEVKFWHVYDFDSDQSKEGWEEVPRASNSKVLAAKGKGDVVVSLRSLKATLAAMPDVGADEDFARPRSRRWKVDL